MASRRRCGSFPKQCPAGTPRLLPVGLRRYLWSGLSLSLSGSGRLGDGLCEVPSLDSRLALPSVGCWFASCMYLRLPPSPPWTGSGRFRQLQAIVESSVRDKLCLSYARDLQNLQTSLAHIVPQDSYLH